MSTLTKISFFKKEMHTKNVGVQQLRKREKVDETVKSGP